MGESFTLTQRYYSNPVVGGSGNKMNCKVNINLVDGAHTNGKVSFVEKTVHVCVNLS